MTRMEIFIDIVIAISMAAVLASLGMGVYAMLRGGEYGQANSNKWMRRRVLTQAVAIGLITVGFIYKAGHH